MTSETEYEKLCDVWLHGIHTLLENYAHNNMVKKVLDISHMKIKILTPHK